MFAVGALVNATRVCSRHAKKGWKWAETVTGSEATPTCTPLLQNPSENTAKYVKTTIAITNILRTVQQSILAMYKHEAEMPYKCIKIMVVKFVSGNNQGSMGQ